MGERPDNVAVPMPEDGPPAITFGWDESDPVTFRDMATLEEFVQERIDEYRASASETRGGDDG